MKSFRHAGNINLRGRKSAMLSCRCCEVYDFRDVANDNDARREIDEAMTDQDYRRELRDEEMMKSELEFPDETYDFFLEYMRT